MLITCSRVETGLRSQASASWFCNSNGYKTTSRSDYNKKSTSLNISETDPHLWFEYTRDDRQIKKEIIQHFISKILSSFFSLLKQSQQEGE